MHLNNKCQKEQVGELGKEERDVKVWGSEIRNKMEESVFRY